MKNAQSFIGMGPAPDGVDLPQGLGMQLAQQPAAMDAFGQLSTDQKTNMVRYIQGATSGPDAKNRIMSSVRSLAENGTWQG